MGEAFNLDDEGWLRHANPLSYMTRFTVLPILVIAFWSRAWLGWYSVIPVLLGLLWAYVNPRAFQKPATTKNWLSKGVLGERVWLNRDKISVPDRHKLAPNVLSLVGGLGLPLLVWGVYAFEVWPTITGLALIYLGKLWFMDRMVWLYEDMKHVPAYKKWLY